MKYLFPLSEWSLTHRPRTWLMHLAIMLNSMRQNTELEPVLIWRGGKDHPVFSYLRMKMWSVSSRRPFDDILMADGFKSTFSHVEVGAAVLLKLEAANFIDDNQFGCGDLDCLWLRQPERIELGDDYPIAAGPSRYLQDKAFNSGVMVMERQQIVEADLISWGRDQLKQGIHSEENMLNNLFPNWKRLSWEHRAFWPMPARTPACVHFHGPKIDQVENLLTKPPTDPESITVKLFEEGRLSLAAWREMSLPYLNCPHPYYNHLTAALR